jgi:LCP family protein required for cell wall assembly
MSGDETVAERDEIALERADDERSPAAESSSAAGTAVEDPETETAPRKSEPGERRVLKRVLIGAGILALILALIVGGGIWFLTERWAGNIDRVSDVFNQIPAGSRPAPATPAQGDGQPVTFLLMGSDTRGHPTEGQLPDGRSDAIMIVRLSGDRQHAQLISIPRDSWVNIPGHGMNKINASYAFGGPTLLIETVEALTNVRIDHFVAIDFDGIIQVTDDLGGVDVKVKETTTNGPYTFPAGVNHLDGAHARWYLGQRYGLQGGDFDRVKRQQQYLKSMFGKLFSTDTFTDPGKLDNAMLAVTKSVVIDDTLSNGDLVSLAFSMRNVTPADINFFTAPVAGTGREGPASVVYLNDPQCKRMWAYLNNDSLSQNASEFKDEQLPDVPR